MFVNIHIHVLPCINKVIIIIIIIISIIIIKLGGIAQLITFLRFLSSSSFFLTICYSFHIHDRILTKLGQ